MKGIILNSSAARQDGHVRYWSKPGLPGVVIYLHRSDEKQLTEDIVALATKYGRYGYRRITALLNNEKGWRANHKRVERIWIREGPLNHSRGES